MGLITNQTFTKEVVDFLKANRDKIYLLYPSSGRDSNEHQWRNCPADYVILCDKEAGKNSIEGKIISIKCDNNFCLRLLYKAEVKASYLICKVDGAFEGGNYETVNSLMWLGRALPILKNEFLYITSYTGRMIRTKNYAEGPVKLIKSDEPTWLKDIPNERSKVGKLIVQRLTKTFHPEYALEIGGRIITIQRKSIWEDTLKLDGFFTSVHCRTAMEYFLTEDLKNKNRFIQEFKEGNSILPVLEEAERMKWDTIGLTPFANGNYHQFLNELEAWDGRYPSVIKMYHLEHKCFSTLYSLSSFIPKNDTCGDCKGSGCDECFGTGALMDYSDLD